MTRACSALLVLAATSCIACKLLPVDAAVQLFPSRPLPPEYGFAAIAATLHERGLQLSVPTLEDVAAVESGADFLVERTRRLLVDTYGPIEIVSIHLAIVDSDMERIPIHKVLALVAETTGHKTGNCIDVIDAEEWTALVAACFLPIRSPPSPGL